MYVYIHLQAGNSQPQMMVVSDVDGTVHISQY